MSTPDKTNESLNLAEAMQDDTSACASVSNSTKDMGTKKVLPDDENANLGAKMTDSLSARLNDLDLKFRDRVVTKDSSSDMVVHQDWGRPPSPFRQSFTPPRSKHGEEEEGTDVTVLEEDKDWKPQQGEVYSRVLEIQHAEPKKYVMAEFLKKAEEEVTEKPEIVSLPCSNCGRKVAPGTMDRHLKFCLQK